jgi:dethiobiotin synthetase
MTSPDLIWISGTGTGVGKSHVAVLTTQGLRRRGCTVWVHKPVAAGDPGEDPATYAALADPAQPAGSACPIQLPEAAAPHVAARVAGRVLLRGELLANLDRCRPPQGTMIIEGAGGLLVPLGSDDTTLIQLLQARGGRLLIVARSDLGTINHTLLTLAVARQHGLTVAGVVVNQVAGPARSLAERTAAAEIARLGQVRVLAELPHGGDAQAAAEGLAAALLD